MTNPRVIASESVIPGWQVFLSEQGPILGLSDGAVIVGRPGPREAERLARAWPGWAVLYGVGSRRFYAVAAWSTSEPLMVDSVGAEGRVAPQTVNRWARMGRLTSIRTIGGHRRYRATEVLALLADGTRKRDH